MKLFIHQTIIK